MIIPVRKKGRAANFFGEIDKRNIDYDIFFCGRVANIAL
jgi:hypothetical protein